MYKNIGHHAIIPFPGPSETLQENGALSSSLHAINYALPQRSGKKEEGGGTGRRGGDRKEGKERGGRGRKGKERKRKVKRRRKKGERQGEEFVRSGM